MYVIYDSSYPIFCFTFSFISVSTCLYTHFFPTRRSSDLGVEARGAPVHTDLRRAPGVTAQDGSLRHSLRHAVESTRDQKSTRLNSSHRCISYAVFCLKKKKTKINNI